MELLTSTDLKLSRLCRLPVRLKLPDLVIRDMLMEVAAIILIIMMMVDVEIMRLAVVGWLVGWLVGCDCLVGWLVS